MLLLVIIFSRSCFCRNRKHTAGNWSWSSALISGCFGGAVQPRKYAYEVHGYSSCWKRVSLLCFLKSKFPFIRIAAFVLHSFDLFAHENAVFYCLAAYKASYFLLNYPFANFKIIGLSWSFSFYILSYMVYDVLCVVLIWLCVINAKYFEANYSPAQLFYKEVFVH